MSAGYAEGNPDLESGDAWGEVIGGDCSDHYKFCMAYCLRIDFS